MGALRVSGVNDLVAPAVVGGVAGLFTSVIATLIAWRVERQRDNRAYKRKLIAEARAGIAAWEISQHGEPHVMGSDPSFIRTEWYNAVASDLSVEARSKVEGDALLLGGGKRNPYASLVNAELNRIESEWGVRPKANKKGV